MKIPVWIVVVVEGGIAGLELCTTDEDEANRTFERLRDNVPPMRGESAQETYNPTCDRFAWNEDEWEVRMWKETVSVTTP